MGQRSQIYVRYNKGKKMVARHLQWNYGNFMINRAYQLLDFIGKSVDYEELKKNKKYTYDYFISNNFDDENELKYSKGYDTDILKSLIELNTKIGSMVKSHDLFEEYEWVYEKENYCGKMIPEEQDNNNGILVIDITDTEIKYGFGLGYENMNKKEEKYYQNNGFKMVNARTYYKKSYDLEYLFREVHKTKEEQEEYKRFNREIYKQCDFIDKNFKLLTDEEYKEIFSAIYDNKGKIKEE